MVQDNTTKSIEESKGTDNKEDNGLYGNSTDEIKKIEKTYQIISTIFFKYGIFILLLIISTVIFIIGLQKKETFNFEKEYEAKEIILAGQYKNNQTKIEEYEKDTNFKIIITQGAIDISEHIISSYNNLLQYKGFTLPRGTFLYEPGEIKDIEYFKDPNYDIEELKKIMNNIIFIDYNEILSRGDEEISLIPLTNNNIEDTFYIQCANQLRLFNGVCNNYIRDFLDGFFVYKISDDFQGFKQTFKNIIKIKKYKNDACDGIDNYIKYTHTTPTEIEELFGLCGNKYIESFNIIQSFTDINNDLENIYIKSSTLKDNELNEYKLISYQQILYNNLENGIPPYEGSYKNYINYLTNILKIRGQEMVNPVYYDITYWFNNLYLIPNLNKIKYQSTPSKREEIESIISELEKINNSNNIEGYMGLRYKITSTKLEEETKKIEGKINTEDKSTVNILLKSIKSLSYLKLISEEIDGNTAKINGYISLTLKNGETLPTPFLSTLELKNGKLVVKEFSLSFMEENLQINDILKIILEQKDYSIPEVYDYIQKNIKIYESNNYNISPCILIMERLEKLNIDGVELLNCNSEKINIIKGKEGNRVLYQFQMNNYKITSIATSNKEIQNFIDQNLSGITTNANTIINIVPNIVNYQPKTSDTTTLIGTNKAIIAIDDLSTFLGVAITDIGERSGRVAAEFSISNIDFIGIYDTNTKILGPIFLKQVSVETESGTITEDPMIKNFSLKLTEDNQNEINKFLIEPIGYLYFIDPNLISKYLPELLATYLESKFHGIILE